MSKAVYKNSVKKQCQKRRTGWDLLRYMNACDLEVVWHIQSGFTYVRSAIDRQNYMRIVETCIQNSQNSAGCKVNFLTPNNKIFNMRM